MLAKEVRILTEVHQAVFGVPNTEETGMVGDLKDIKRLLLKQNGRIRRLEVVVVAVAVSLGGGIWGTIQLVLGG